ncbi:hypothetical protein Lser_V15G44896 [Lactuca serriola]
MMGSDLELGDSTNPKVESESFVDGSSSENRVDSASIHLTGPSDSSTVVQGVESVVAEGSLDSVSAEGNVSDVNNRGAGDSSKLGVSESDNKDVSSDRNHGSVKRTKNEHKKGQRRKETKSKESVSPAYDSMLSMFDDFAANGSVGTEVRSSMEGSGLGSPGHGYEVGDMVWGKVKSHPWWPGHVFSEEFATTSVRRSKREGLLLVAFFGDSSYGWFDPSELMPFESNFAEKSRQTSSKTFVKAVEEAMDEVSRRNALGLSCMCRSKQNFRKTDVKGYYAVDVADYEPGAVYSINAIEKARASFQPSSALDFIRQLALEPNVEHVGIDLIKNKARVVSYRRAVYEEFDDTYAQAFGHELDRPSPAKAPLSGRQVFADTSGKGKNPARSNKSKENAKKDKYLFKRREESKEILKPPQKEKEKLPIPSSPQLSHVDDSTAIAAGDFVLQKRAPATPPPPPPPEQVTNPPILPESPSKEDTPIPILPESGDPSPATTTKAESDVSGDDEKKTEEDKKVNIMENGTKKVKVSKRPAGVLSSGKPISPEKKKKRKKESLSSETTEIHEKDPIPFPSKTPIEEKEQEPQELKLSHVLNDLQSLALDPFNAINKGLAIKTRQVFLKFRSLVFQKSLNSSPPPDNAATSPEENTVKLPPVKPENTISARPDDPTKGGRKRGPSDRQEEMAARKKKKVGDIKNLTKEKKVIKKLDDPPPAPPARKPDPGQGRRAAPTVLIMRFPPDGSLPSINELKATFVRFGPMDYQATRILWKSLQCRVVFKYHADAQEALKMAVRSGSLFGNSGVRCSLRAVADFEPPAKVKEDHQHHHHQQQSAVQLKSCLKKSGGEDGGGGGGRGAARVKFVLDGDESHHNKNKKNGDGGGGGGGGGGGSSSFSSSSSSSSSSHATMDFNSKNFQKTSSSLPLLPLPLPLSTSSGVGSSSGVQFTRPPLIPLAPPLIPLAPPLLPTPTPTPRSFNYGGDMAPLPPPPPVGVGGKYVHNLQRPNIGQKVDVSQQMLRLMRKCNEVVTNVRNTLGYVPYHPL